MILKFIKCSGCCEGEESECFPSSKFGKDQTKFVCTVLSIAMTDIACYMWNDVQFSLWCIMLMCMKEEYVRLCRAAINTGYEADVACSEL